ncbi:MAG: flagellar protein [Halanaerobiales bacterium]
MDSGKIHTISREVNFMDLRNCPQCGKLFAYDGRNKVCQVCRNNEESDYEKVKEYLWDNPNASIEKVHLETEVERELIIKFIRDGRLVAEGINVEMLIECERCGKPIITGRFCPKCKQALIDGFKPSDSKKKEKREKEARDDKMFIVDRVKKREQDK